jgi:hypothetical protein
MNDPAPRDRALDLELFGFYVERVNADGTRTAIDPTWLRFDPATGKHYYLGLTEYVLIVPKPSMTFPIPMPRCTCDDHCEGPCPVHYPDPTWNCLSGLDHD